MIRVVKIFCSMLFVLLIYSSSFANTRIYLLPEVKISGNSLKIGDIAVVEGPESSSVFNLVLTEKRSGSVIIDKREIQTFLTEKDFSKFTIFGNGVRVTFSSDSEKDAEVSRENVINSGDTVELTLFKNGVRVEVQGQSLAGGAIGDTVRVRVGKGRVLNGIVKGRGRVLLEI